jgi:RNA polymerase sigma-70 factor (ECF subfamily)
VADDESQRDEELVALIPERKEVLGILIDRYDGKLRRYLMRLMPGIQDELDDALQEIFIKVYVNARSFDTSLSFSSWIYRIAHNEAVSWLRKHTARPQTQSFSDDEFELFRTAMEHDTDMQQHTLVKDEVARVLIELPEKYRTVLVLQFLEGKSYRDMSDILSIPEGSVATLIHRAKKSFISTYTHHGASA